MARATGIEITETSVRVAELEGGGKKFRLVGAVEAPIEPNSSGERGLEETQAALKQALKAAKAKREFVVLGIPAAKATIREIQIPFTSDDQIKKVLKFECESHLPTQNIEDVVVDYHKIGEMGPRSRLLIVAVPKPALKEQLLKVSRSGIDPSHVDLDAAALFARARQIPGLDDDDEKGAKVILDLGETTSTILVGTGEHLRMVRCLRMGAESLTRAISTDLGIDRSEARTMTQQMLRADAPFATVAQLEAAAPAATKTSRELQGDILKDKQDELARRISAEIRRSLSSVQLEPSLVGIWITGPAARTPGLESRLADNFRVPVRPLDTLHGLDHSGLEASSSFIATAVGLAQKALGYDPLGLEFRQEEFRFTKRFDQLRTPLLFAGALLLVLFVFLGINEFKRQEAMIRDTQTVSDICLNEYQGMILKRGADPNRINAMGYANVDESAKEEERLVKLKGLPRVTQIRSSINRIERHLTDNFGVVFENAEGSKPPELEARSALFRLDQFMGCFGRAKDKVGWFSIDKLQVSSTDVVWSMLASSADSFGILQAEFEKLEGYVTAKVGTTKSVGDKYLYTNCRLEFEREN